MYHQIVTIVFKRGVPMSEVDGTLRLARLACDALYGADRVEFEAQHEIDHGRRICRIDTASDVGVALAAVFRGYARREFGVDAFEIKRARRAKAMTERACA